MHTRKQQLIMDLANFVFVLRYKIILNFLLVSFYKTAFKFSYVFVKTLIISLSGSINLYYDLLNRVLYLGTKVVMSKFQSTHVSKYYGPCYKVQIVQYLVFLLLRYALASSHLSVNISHT